MNLVKLQDTKEICCISIQCEQPIRKRNEGNNLICNCIKKNKIPRNKPI